MFQRLLVAQSCPMLCNPIDCTPPGFSVHGILQARIMEWSAIPFARGSSQPRDRTQVSCTVGRFLTIWTIREALLLESGLCLCKKHYILQNLHLKHSLLRNENRGPERNLLTVYLEVHAGGKLRKCKPAVFLGREKQHHSQFPAETKC